MNIVDVICSAPNLFLFPDLQSGGYIAPLRGVGEESGRTRGAGAEIWRSSGQYTNLPGSPPRWCLCDPPRSPRPAQPTTLGTLVFDKIESGFVVAAQIQGGSRVPTARRRAGGGAASGGRPAVRVGNDDVRAPTRSRPASSGSSPPPTALPAGPPCRPILDRSMFECRCSVLACH